MASFMYASNPPNSGRACTAVLVLLSYCAPNLSLAAENQTQIEELIVSASLLPTDRAKLSSSVSLLTAEEIARRNPVSVVDLLRGIEGVQISQPGGRGGVTSLYLRGGESNFTSVFIDGVKVNNPNNTRGGSFDFATLDLGNIERVEIIRGPQSAIYGSDALSGVVNFISRKATQDEIKLRLEAGESGFSRTVASGSKMLSSQHQLSIGAARNKDSNSQSGGDFELTSVWANLRGESKDQTAKYHLSISTADSEQSRFPDDSGGGTLAQIRTLDRGTSDDEQASFRLHKKWGPSWDSQLLLTHYEREELSDSPGVTEGIRDPVPANRFDSNLTRRYFQFSNRFTSNKYLMTFGADFQREEASSSGEVLFAPNFALPSQYEIDRSIAGVFIDGNYAVSEGLELLASLRYDDPDDASSRLSPSVGIINNFSDGKTEMRANWSKGFKLPSFFALASPLVGNPDLREEEVTSLDVEFSHQLSNTTELTLALFNSDYEDLVDFDSEAFTNVNRSEVNIRGAETAIELGISSQLWINAFVTYQDIDIKSGGRLRQRPDWQSGIELNYQPSEKFQVYGRFTEVGSSFDSSIPTGDSELNSYSRVDVSASWKLSESLRIDAAVDNLLDEDYFEAIGFQALGRRARLALEWRI